MESYPLPAHRLVAELIEQAAGAPHRTISFQGAPGANSHQAVRDARPDAIPLPCFSFEDAIDAVREGRAGQAMIPIENSIHGRVADIHFLLPESGLSIVAEHFLRVRHCLVGAGTIDDVREAMSHPQALGQCRHWLRGRGIKPVVNADTAGAAAQAAELGDPRIGAISSRLASELYGLNLLSEGIEDEAHNTTRFVILAREAETPPPGAPSMTSFLFEVKNTPASLYKALGCFATNGVNMTKLESYQRGGSFQATEFFADIQGDPSQPAVAAALEELTFHAKSVRMLGSYPQGEANR